MRHFEMHSTEPTVLPNFNQKIHAKNLAGFVTQNLKLFVLLNTLPLRT
jgi:hypothetical protein